MGVGLINKDDALKNVSGIVDSMSVCISTDYCNGMRAMKRSVLREIEELSSIDAVPREWWDELKETVSELVENNKDVPENKQFYDCARFLLNLMNVISKGE